MTAGCMNPAGPFTRAAPGDGGAFVVGPGPFGTALRRYNAMPAAASPHTHHCGGEAW
jgi:hypothetical protein